MCGTDKGSEAGEFRDSPMKPGAVGGTQGRSQAAT
jgi:hypothetical protein